MQNEYIDKVFLLYLNDSEHLIQGHKSKESANKKKIYSTRAPLLLINPQVRKQS